MTFRFSHAQMMAEWMAYRVTAAGAIRLLDFSTAEEFVAAYTMLISEGCTSLKEQMHAIFINQLTQCRCVNNALTRLSTASVCRQACTLACAFVLQAGPTSGARVRRVHEEPCCAPLTQVLTLSNASTRAAATRTTRPGVWIQLCAWSRDGTCACIQQPWAWTNANVPPLPPPSPLAGPWDADRARRTHAHCRQPRREPTRPYDSSEFCPNAEYDLLLAPSGCGRLPDIATQGRSGRRLSDQLEDSAHTWVFPRRSLAGSKKKKAKKAKKRSKKAIRAAIAQCNDRADCLREIYERYRRQVRECGLMCARVETKG